MVNVDEMLDAMTPVEFMERVAFYKLRDEKPREEQKTIPEMFGVK